MQKQVCVIDAQGGGIGVSLIKYLREFYGESIEITAMGTNAIAASQMMKAGANRANSLERMQLSILLEKLMLLLVLLQLHGLML